MKKLNFALVALLALCLLLPAVAAAAEPKAVIDKNMGEFVKILKDAKYAKGANKAEQDKLIWDILEKVFDFNVVARRALGRNWKRFSAAEQAEFVPVFKDLLGTNYLHRIKKGYRDEKVVINGQEKVSDRKAVVETQIVRAGGNVPVSYSLYENKGDWKVYDVKVEGVSLIKNYRTQFNQILLNKKPADLIARVKKQLAELKEKIKKEG